jgi:hypothetical protein
VRDRKTLNTSAVPREEEGFLKTKGEDDRKRRREYQNQRRDNHDKRGVGQG